MKGTYATICCIALLCLMLSHCGARAANAAGGDNRDVYTVTIGDIRVSMLSESQRESDAGVLIGAVSEDMETFLPNGKYPSAVAAFLVRTPASTVLVDTGFGREIERNMKTLGLTPRNVDTLLLTHSHGDHIGGLLKDGKPAFPKARVFLSHAEYDWSAAVRTALAGYGGNVTRITPGTFGAPGPEPVQGIRAIAAYGHTPGHTLYLVESKGERLLIWGDLTHAMAIQMPRPDVSVTYDSNSDQAAAVRRAVLRYVSENRIPVAGMHIPYPGIGRVEPDPQNPDGYRFIPWTK